jgi:hypothetical protein
LIVVLPALVTIASIGISALPHLALRVAAVGVVLVLSISPLRAYYGTSVREGGDWRQATEYVMRGKRPGDGILFLSMYGRRPFEYYVNRFTDRDELVPVYPSQRWGSYPPVLVDNDIESTSTAAERLDRHTRVWVMLHWGGFESAAEDGAPLKHALQAGFRQVSARSLGPSLEVRLYERERSRVPY